MEPVKIADEAIGLFLEYRDVHGKDETTARSLVLMEVAQARLDLSLEEYRKECGDLGQEIGGCMGCGTKFYENDGNPDRECNCTLNEAIRESEDRHPKDLPLDTDFWRGADPAE